MAIFKTQWVVLHVWKYSENQLYYQLFFRDYGVLTVSKRKKAKEKPVDIWYFISCEVITKEKNSVHTIGNIKILSFFETQNISYSHIESFLLLLGYIKNNLPNGSPHYEIFDIISQAIDSQDTLNVDKLILTHIKVIACFWNLWDTHKDPTTQKILKFIHTNKYSQIMKLWAIPEENKKHLEYLL
jgi:recombinational DNA repair protein (RecF pathway)